MQQMLRKAPHLLPVQKAVRALRCEITPIRNQQQYRRAAAARTTTSTTRTAPNPPPTTPTGSDAAAHPPRDRRNENVAGQQLFVRRMRPPGGFATGPEFHPASPVELQHPAAESRPVERVRTANRGPRAGLQRGLRDAHAADAAGEYPAQPGRRDVHHAASVAAPPADNPAAARTGGADPGKGEAENVCEGAQGGEERGVVQAVSDL